VLPVIESLRATPYPRNVEDLAPPVAASVLMVPAGGIADALGNARLASTVLLGVLSVYLDIPGDAWLGAIQQSVPPKTVDANIAAFRHGAEWRIAREKAVTAF
jgi:indolepyruvate ferredoxin oxidoreductase, beta subunit